MNTTGIMLLLLYISNFLHYRSLISKIFISQADLFTIVQFPILSMMELSYQKHETNTSKNRYKTETNNLHARINHLVKTQFYDIVMHQLHISRSEGQNKEIKLNNSTGPIEVFVGNMLVIR